MFENNIRILINKIIDEIKYLQYLKKNYCDKKRNLFTKQINLSVVLLFLADWGWEAHSLNGI